MGRDSIYWMFSSSAQAVSALFAFLLAGIAVVQAMMADAQQRDDSLEEIHARLSREHYRRLIILADVAGAAIVLSLLLVFLNGSSQGPNPIAIGLVSLVDVSAILGTIWFVVWMVNPDRYRRTAKVLVAEETHKLGLPAPTQDPREFFAAFVKLEAAVRRISEARSLDWQSTGATRVGYSFRQMINTLQHNQVITPDFHRELLELSRYRNLIFHGREDRVDESLLRRTRDALAQATALEKAISLRRKPSPASRPQ
jgi:hypothetical protein